MSMTATTSGSYRRIEQVKTHPVVVTSRYSSKGKGYTPAEANKSGTGTCRDIQTGQEPCTGSSESYASIFAE